MCCYDDNCIPGLNTIHTTRNNDFAVSINTGDQQIIFCVQVFQWHVNIAAIKNSKVGQYIQFYNVPDEKEIANAILNINLNNKTNNVDVVKELDKEFKEDLKDMLVKYE